MIVVCLRKGYNGAVFDVEVKRAEERLNAVVALSPRAIVGQESVGLE